MHETNKGPFYIKFPEKTPEQIRKEIEHAWPGTRELNDLEWECRLPPATKRGRVLEDHELKVPTVAASIIFGASHCKHLLEGVRDGGLSECVSWVKRIRKICRIGY